LRDARKHDGKIMGMRPNLRWCLDTIESTCWDSEVIRLAFIIDAYDHEIISWEALTNTGIEVRRDNDKTVATRR